MHLKKCSWLLVLLFALTACGVNLGEILPTETPLSLPPTSFVLPTVEPIPGWLMFPTREIEVWLPDSYFGGDPAIDLALMTQFLRQYDAEGQRQILTLEQNYTKWNFFAFDTDPTDYGILTTIHISTEIVPPATVLENYMTSAINTLPVGYQVIEQGVGSINGLQSARFVLEYPLPDRPGKEVRYIIQENSTRLWILTFSTTKDDFDTQVGIFQQIVRSFRSNAMQQQQDLAASQPTPTAEGLILFDDFSDSSSGWTIASNELTTIYYSGGSYHIFVYQPDVLSWATIGEEYSRVSLEVDAWQAGTLQAEAYSELGLICGYQDAENFYYLSIRTDGKYGIYQMRPDGEILLGMPDWVDSPAINIGTTPNKLKADCIDNTLRLYANGQLLGEVVTPTAVTGRVGLFAGSFTWPDSHTQFDNFAIYQP